MSLLRAREFFVGAFHDLPNVLFVGSLVLGSMLGYLPLVWLAIGMLLNGAIVSILQGLLAVLFVSPSSAWGQVAVERGAYACEILSSESYSPLKSGLTIVAPSHWLAATIFFSTFSIYNSIRVAMREATPGTSSDLVDVRRAFSLSAMVVGIVFFALVLGRGFTGCETWLGGGLGTLLGVGTAIGYWHLLDACGTGLIPDILQVVASSAPPGSGETVPVICTPEKHD